MLHVYVIAPEIIFNSHNMETYNTPFSIDELLAAGCHRAATGYLGLFCTVITKPLFNKAIDVI